EEGVERLLPKDRPVPERRVGKQSPSFQESKVEDEVTDRHTNTALVQGERITSNPDPLLFRDAEDAVGEVLDREMRLRRDGDERPQARVGRGRHDRLSRVGNSPSLRRSSRGSSKLQLPKPWTSPCRASRISATLASWTRQRNPVSSKWKLL